MEEPNYCHRLAQGPAQRDPELNHGGWLVLVYAIWSGPDIQMISVAQKVAKRFAGRLELGLRPYDYPEEIKTWCPEAAVWTSSPVWLILHGGELLLILQGV